MLTDDLPTPLGLVKILDSILLSGRKKRKVFIMIQVSTFEFIAPSSDETPAR